MDEQIIIGTYPNPRGKIFESFPEEDREILPNYIHVCPSQEMIQGFYSGNEIFHRNNNNPIQTEPLITVQRLIEAFYGEWLGMTDNAEYILDDNGNIAKNTNAGKAAYNSVVLNQLKEVEEIISKIDLNKIVKEYLNADELTEAEENTIRNSLYFNTASITESVKLLFELGADETKFDRKKLSLDQNVVIEIYSNLKIKKSDFFFERIADGKVDAALCRALLKTISLKHKKDPDADNIIRSIYDKTRKAAIPDNGEKVIVFDGIFRFPALLLNVIDDLKAAGYKIYMLFNYRKEREFGSFYQSWLNIYRCFGDIRFGDNPDSKQGALTPDNYRLALALGKAAEGEPVSKEDIGNTKLEVYSSIVLFAAKINNSFNEALKAEKSKTGKTYIRTLSFMKDMPYSTSRRANELLRAFHPRQFGDAKLTDYPIGMFLMSAAKLWDNDIQRLSIRDEGSLANCIRGLYINKDSNTPLPEKDPVKLTATLHAVFPYIQKDKNTEEAIISLSKMIGLTKIAHDTIEDFVKTLFPKADNNSTVNAEENNTKIRENNRNTFFSEGEILIKTSPVTMCSTGSFNQLSLAEIPMADIWFLIEALYHITRVAEKLVRSFSGEYSFQKRLVSALELIFKSSNLDPDATGAENAIAARLYTMREELKSESGGGDNGKYYRDQLKAMLSGYLDRNIAEDASSANWIVHDLVQIDGDILIEPAEGTERINHFCFLSDKEMCSDPEDLFPWPLDMKMFDNSPALDEGGDVRLEVFRRAKREQKNFAKYALLYGILFSSVPVRLSYVKHIGEEQREPYHLFKLMGLPMDEKKGEIDPENDSVGAPDEPYKPDSVYSNTGYSTNLFCMLCSYHYIFDHILHNDTMYRDRFSILNYVPARIISDALVKNNNCDTKSFINELEKMGFLTEADFKRINSDVPKQTDRINNSDQYDFFKNSISRHPTAHHSEFFFSMDTFNLVQDRLQHSPGLIFSENLRDLKGIFNSLPWRDKTTKQLKPQTTFEQNGNSCTWCPYKNNCRFGLISKVSDDD